MKSYKSFMYKANISNDKTILCKITCIKPNSENKGSMYVFNNEAHVKFTNTENIKKIFDNILRNGCCNGIPSEIGGIEDRTITSIMIDFREIKNLKDLINNAETVLAELLLEKKYNNQYKVEIAETIITSLKKFKDQYFVKYARNSNIVYFDFYAQGYCDGYLTLRRNYNQMIDFVRMQGFSSVEELKVAGSTMSGLNAGYIRPAPFTIGPLVFNPIGNDSVDITSDGLIIEYIGMLREQPTNFKEFRVYLTIDLKPNTISKQFVGKSKPVYDNFKMFIDTCNSQAVTGELLDNINKYSLPFLLDSMSVEIQGDNPENIEAIDIITILHKAVLVLSTNDLSMVTSSDSELVDPTNLEVISKSKCKLWFKVDNSVELEPIFIDKY